MLRQKLSAVAPAQWLGPVKRQPLGWGSESGATERSWSAIIYAVRSTSRSSHIFPQHAAIKLRSQLIAASCAIAQRLATGAEAPSDFRPANSASKRSRSICEEAGSG